MRAPTRHLCAATLLALALVPAARSDAAGKCIRRDVGWESYEQWCVEPTDPDCPVSYSYHALGDDRYACYPERGAFFTAAGPSAPPPL